MTGTTTPPPLLKRLKRALRYGVIRVALALVGWLPARALSELGDAVGRLAYLVAVTDRRRALESLQVAFPHLSEAERRALARACFRHLGRMTAELVAIEELDRDIDDWVVWAPDSRAVLDQALKRGRGVVFVSGHVGAWELLARRVALAGYRASSIAKEAPDARLTALIERFRASGRLQTIWRGRPGAARAMLAVLKAGGILGLLIDQDTDVQSVFVPFFGRLAKTPLAAAELALRTQAPLVLGFCHRVDGRYRLTMREVNTDALQHDEAGVHALTAQLTEAIELAIRTHPEQWVWMHRRWKSRPGVAPGGR